MRVDEGTKCCTLFTIISNARIVVGREKRLLSGLVLLCFFFNSAGSFRLVLPYMNSNVDTIVLEPAARLHTY